MFFYKPLGRTLRESDHIGAEYIDDLGRTYDQLGDPRASAYWDERQFFKSIDQHLLKSNDFTVIDMTGFASEQVESVAAYVGSLPIAAQQKIVAIGF